MITKKIAGTLAIGVITFGITLGAFLTGPVSAACAATNPNLTVRYRVANISKSGPWGDSASGNPGDVLEFSMELHNTVVGSDANNPRVQALFTQGNFTSGRSVARFMADNAAEARDEVGLNLSPASSLAYIPGSARINWNPSGDGTPEFSNSPLSDGIASSGVNLPNSVMHGCNAYIAQVWFLVRVKGENVQPSPTPSPRPSASPSPTPSPRPSSSPSPSATPRPSATPTPVPSVSPSPVASPTPTPEGGVSCPEGFNQQLQGNVIVCVQNNNNNNNNNNQNQEQTQNNNQEQNVNITNNVTNPSPAVLSASIPLKSPDTGVGVLGMVSMFSAAPIGLALSRYGRGRITLGKREEEENLGSIANGLFNKRKENSAK